MFYIKIPLDQTTVITADITHENVFTRCAQCGKELQYDLDEDLAIPRETLIDSKVFCSKKCCCAYHREHGMDILCEEDDPDDLDPFGEDDAE